LIVGKKSLPADDLKGLIAYLMANPDKASVGIAGVGATGHLTGISFQKETGTKFQSCRIAAMHPRCRIFWRNRSIS
jgi:tripartite-type tricarboxylate transporter receptor subunit TctC